MAAKKIARESLKFTWGAAFLIALGLILLLQNLGLLSNNVRDIIGTVWPVFLILAGLHILYHKQRT